MCDMRRRGYGYNVRLFVRFVGTLVTALCCVVTLAACSGPVQEAHEDEAGVQTEEAAQAEHAVRAEEAAQAEEVTATREDGRGGGVQLGGTAKTVETFLAGEDGAELSLKLRERASVASRKGAYEITFSCKGNTLVYTVTLDEAYSNRVDAQTVATLDDNERARDDNEEVINRMEELVGVEDVQVTYDFVAADGTPISSYTFGA